MISIDKQISLHHVSCWHPAHLKNILTEEFFKSYAGGLLKNSIKNATRVSLLKTQLRINYDKVSVPKSSVPLIILLHDFYQNSILQQLTF